VERRVGKHGDHLVGVGDTSAGAEIEPRRIGGCPKAAMWEE
jgi:hypothetical protein